MAQLQQAGDPAPFLAIVGVSLASGSGLVTKQDEIESVCSEIRQAVAKTSLLDQSQERVEKHPWSIKDFNLGKPIAKGCNAVVYEARLVKDGREGAECEPNFHPFAIKMMFNYEAESNALSILRAMSLETLPARCLALPDEVRELHSSLGCTGELPPHPNIVEMLVVFADQVPQVQGDAQLYGSALPRRLHPGGLGRNMSLFLVMRKYSMSLAQYLEQESASLTARVRLLLLTQLLEGVAHLAAHGVAHRDIKADNILINLSGGAQAPHLVITDFGCSLVSPSLSLPFPSWETNRGGNAALLAPEVSRARPGKYSTLEYSKSDLWVAGTLAYEIYSGCNPWLSSLDTRRYLASEVPDLPGSTPPLVSRLITALTSPLPSERPQPRTAATLCQLLLWAPSAWYSSIQAVDTQDILQWLLTMTTKVVTESRWGNTGDALLEYQLVATFLAEMSIQDIRVALDWIHDSLEEE